ncbi:hypothetical protein [Hydrogenimonas sp.]
MIIKQLEQHLEKNKEKLIGEWIKNNSSYDGYICSILNMQEDTVRYWDAIWNDQQIEFKKGNSIWLDLVRYSEILLKVNTDASKETLTLFFIPNKTKDKIEEVICVTTKKLIEYIKLDREKAEQLILLNKNVPRSLNAQASLTKKDIRNIAIFII